MENDNNKNKDPEFINEVVKEDKRRKKSLLFKVVIVLITAAAAAFVAGVVFAFTYTGVRSAIGEADSDSSKISISGEESSSSSSPASSSVSSSDTETGSSSASSEDGEDPEVITEIIYDADLTVDDYKKLYSEMYDTASEAQDSIVSVAGITSQIDYFNESYENEQRSIGLVVAQNDSEYYILTYSSILQNAGTIRVTFMDEFSAAGTLQRSDPNTGFAVIKVSKEGLPQEVIAEVLPARFGVSSSVKAGDLIIVIGNPDGYDDYIAYGSVTSTSNKTTLFDAEYDILTTNVPDGSEGIGILLDLNGNVIGITSADTDDISDTTITALPIAAIRELIETLSNNESRAYAGILGYDVTEQISAETGMPTGMIVVSMAESSPAMMSGLMEYDIITAVDGIPVTSMSQYADILKNYEPGMPVNLSVMRQVSGGYSPMDITFNLGEI
jgi:serine protease Do